LNQSQKVTYNIKQLYMTKLPLQENTHLMSTKSYCKWFL